MNFLSNHFSSKEKKETTKSPPPSSGDQHKCQSRFHVKSCPQPIAFQDRHPFLKQELLQPKSKRSQALLADFRARGATVRRPVVVDDKAHNKVDTKDDQKLKSSVTVTKDIDKIQGHDEQFIKIFLGSQLTSSGSDQDSNVMSRVKFPVLYSNYSAQSKTESNFCVYPSSIVMELSGSNSLTLRSFLDNYCFRSDYKCPNNECKSSQITDHIRKFGYSNGSVCLTIKPDEPVAKETTSDTEPKTETESVIMSSTFCDICDYRSDYAPLSDDFMSMSFAKFLMLRICGQEYIKKQMLQDEVKPVTECNHESFLRHSQYFRHKNLVAAFEYCPINVRYIFLPLIDIKVKLSLKQLREETCEELKKVTVRGWECHGVVHDKVTNLKDELQSIALGQPPVDQRSAQLMQMMEEYIKMEEKDRNEYRKSIEQIQVDLCSKNQDIESTFQVYNNIYFLKKQIVNFVDSWNLRITELNKKRSMKGNSSSTSLSRPDSVKHVPSLIHTAIPECAKPEARSMETSTDDVFNRSENSNKSVEVDAVFKSDESADELLEKLSLSPSEKSGEETPGIRPFIGDDATSSDGNVTDESYAVYRTLTEADKHLLDEIDARRQAEITAANKRAKGANKTSLSRMLDQFRPGPFVQEFEVPFGKNEHYNLPVNENLPILVRDDDAGSMIAFTLASHEYDYQLKLLGHPELNKSASGNSQAQPGDTTVDASFDSQVSVTSSGVTFVKDKSNDPTNDGSIEITFEDATLKFSCNVYFATRFRKLRSSIIKLDIDDHSSRSSSVSIEEMFIRSLSTAIEWNAVGGKSGSRFRKTLDHRFIIKEMNNQEVQSFKIIARKYFDYIEQVVREGRRTALAKVLGVYKIVYKNTITGTSTKMYVLVIENIFFGRKIIQKFDLKGSGRNRFVNLDAKKPTKSADDEVVLMDTNLVQLIRDSPLYVRPEEKRLLQNAIDDDTTFLTSLELIDYSLLVGIDDADTPNGVRGQLVVGIIDYIRSYTWDKKIESAVKSSISGKEPPTIVKPELYKERFLNRMNQYFLPIPDSESKVDLLESSSTVIVL